MKSQSSFYQLLILLLLLFCFASSPLLAIDTTALANPNVVVILTDDQGWGDLSLNGNTNLATPNIDSIGRQGARFDRFFVCPVCSPTRAEFLTGRYHPRGGVYDTSRGGERLNLGERTIAELFKSAGYRTGIFGKWHNGMQYPYHPNARGFNEFYGFCSGHWGDYFSPPLEHNGKIVKGNGFIADDLTNHAMEFIRQNKDQSFFVYLPLPTPHSPMQVPDEYWTRFKDKKLGLQATKPDVEQPDFTRAALAMVENVDFNVGRLMKQLDELKLSDNTIVVFFCDNGPNSDRWNGGMKGRKGSTDEGGVRSPLLIRWPGKIAAGKLITQISGAIDLLPTLTDLAQVSKVGVKPLDGVSLKPLLTGAVTSIPDRKIFSHWAGKVSVRTQHHRLDHQGNLFDMLADPEQSKPVNKKLPDVAAAVSEWKAQLLPGLNDDKRSFPVGHPDFLWSLLPARDGTPHGSINRSAKAPNSSYFTHWSSVDDKITWPIEVLEAGQFMVELYYTCAASDVGVELELSFGDNKITEKVVEAHDPPATGAEHDRVPRQTESLVKDFKPMRLGTIKLDKGVGDLTLRATKLPGKAGPEVRQLMFRRVP
jgi:arylsulfatase A-like enzyme